MIIDIQRTVNKFGSGNKEYGKLLIVDERLSQYVGKKVNLKIDIEEVKI